MLKLSGAYRVHADSIDSLELLPDGETALTACQEVDDEGELIGNMKVWHPEKGVLRRFQDSRYSCFATSSNDGCWLAWGGFYGQVCVIRWGNTSTPRVYQLPNDNTHIKPIRFTPDSSLVFRSVGDDLWWKLNIACDRPPEQASYEPAHVLAFSPVLRLLAFGQRNTVFLRALPTDTVCGTFEAFGSAHTITSLAFHPQRSLLAVASQAGIRVWDSSDTTRVRLVLDIGIPASALSYLPNGMLVVARVAAEDIAILDSTGRQVSGSDPNDFAELRSLPGEEADDYIGAGTSSEVTVIAVSSNGCRIAAGTIGGGVAIWNSSRFLA